MSLRWVASWSVYLGMVVVVVGCSRKADQRANHPSVPNPREEASAPAQPEIVSPAPQSPVAVALERPQWWPDDYPLPEVKSNCVRCHLTAGRELTAPLIDFAGSVHDRDELSCNDCHGGNTDKDEEAHEADFDFIGTKLSAHIASCGNCHDEQNSQYQVGKHAWDWSEKVNLDYPMCLDCHGHHDIGKPPEDFRLTLVCADCHEAFSADMPRLASIVSENDRLWKTLRRAYDENDGTLPEDLTSEIAIVRTATANLIHPTKRVEGEASRKLIRQMTELREKLEKWLGES